MSDLTRKRMDAAIRRAHGWDVTPDDRKVFLAGMKAAGRIAKQYRHGTPDIAIRAAIARLKREVKT